jgi:hypothetical protein
VCFSHQKNKKIISKFFISIAIDKNQKNNDLVRLRKHNDFEISNNKNQKANDLAKRSYAA